MKYKILLAAILTNAVALAPAKLYLLPSNTQLSGNSNWVTFDFAYADDIFVPIWSGGALDLITARSPAGTKMALQNGLEGKLRTVFELELVEKGTYAVESSNEFYYVKYKKDGEEKLQKWRGSEEDFLEKIKDKAFADSVDQVRHYVMRADTFVTLGEPTNNGLKASGKGFDFDFLTNPTDFYVGEKGAFVLKQDGKPVANTEVELERASARYLPKRAATKLKTDANGKIEIEWKTAGQYVLSVEYKGEKPENKLTPQQRLRYYAAFEVLGE